MNIEELAKRTHIELKEQEKRRVEKELRDVVDLLEPLKELQTHRKQPRTTKTELREDTPVTQHYESTSKHEEDGKIQSPKP